MKNSAECLNATGIIFDYKAAHRIRARHIGGVGIGKNLDNDPTDEASPEYAVCVGVMRGPVPPRLAPVIERLLEEAGLVVPVKYTDMSQAIAQ